MSQGLQLSQNLSLKQVLAPQMQQSLAMLQAPILELRTLVEQELQQNPMLEEVPVVETEMSEKVASGEADESVSAKADPAEPPADMKFDPATEKPSEQPVDDFQAEFERLTQMDQEWRDHFAQTNIPLRSNEDEEEKRQFTLDSLMAVSSLQEDLLEQLRMSDLVDGQQSVGEMLIGNIDDSGYLKSSVEELSFATNLPAEKILEVLKTIQTFHPPGVGARDLRECLLLQMERAGLSRALEYRIVSEHMEELGRHKFPELARTLGVTVSEVQKAAARIAKMSPRPALNHQSEADAYIVPEIFVQRIDDQTLSTSSIVDPIALAEGLARHEDENSAEIYDRLLQLDPNPDKEAAKRDLDACLAERIDFNKLVRDLVDRLNLILLAGARHGLSIRQVEDAFPGLIAKKYEYAVVSNDDHVPRLRISNHYKDLMADPDSPQEVRDYIRNKIQAGKFLIKSIHQRQSTILNIAREIVKRQQEFMEKGVQALKPMTMAQVAEVVKVHETTVSRAVSGKFMETPQGVFEMRYFFTSGLQTEAGGGVSNETVKEMIADIFRNEDPKRPLSDQEVLAMLKAKGIVIARRTVAKYRAELNILPSNLRRVF